MQCDLFLTSDARAIYYFTGSLGPEDAASLLLLWTDGFSALFTTVETPGFAEQVELVPNYSLREVLDRPFHDAVRMALPTLRARPTRQCAMDCAHTRAIFCQVLGTDRATVDASGLLLRMRKRKEPDEVEEIRENLRYCAAAYDAARKAVVPGATEIDVYNAMNSAVTLAAGRPIPFPGDFACGTRAIRGGGPPTRRVLERGDLYILDLFPAVRYYFADTCRTFVVGEASEEQLRAHEAVVAALRAGEQAIRPGVAARDIYHLVKEQLDATPESDGSFWHHAGHGIGFRGHEAPHIIPGSEDVFEPGDVFTLEPGIYVESLRGGIRLEDNYVLGPTGLLENLFDYPMTL